MTTDLSVIQPPDDVVLLELQRVEDRLPAMFQAESQKTRWRFIDFFTSSIRNPNTRAAYQRAILQFLNWCVVLDPTIPWAPDKRKDWDCKSAKS